MVDAAGRSPLPPKPKHFRSANLLDIMISTLTAMQPTKAQLMAALKQIEKFSPAPVILSKALKLLADPNSDLTGIADLVGSDPALAADIIRCANSAFYAGGNCKTIADAMQKIGTRETVRLLNLAVGRIVSGRDLTCYGIHGTDFWAESLFNGLFMQALAKESGEADPDEAYTVGLLRFIGRLAINQAIENLRAGLFWLGGESIAQWEQESVGLVQAQAGAMLLGKWRFPETMVRAIAAQDAPMVLEEKSWLAEALFFSSALLPQGAGASFLPSLGASLIMPAIGTEFLHRSGLNSGEVETLLRSTGESFEAIRKNFGA